MKDELLKEKSMIEAVINNVREELNEVNIKYD
jgi:hypothetical protein